MAYSTPTTTPTHRRQNGIRADAMLRTGRCDGLAWMELVATTTHGTPHGDSTPLTTPMPTNYYYSYAYSDSYYYYYYYY